MLRHCGITSGLPRSTDILWGGPACRKGANWRHRRETTAAHPWISSLASRLILVDPEGYEGTDEAQHENAGSRYGDEVN
jgi:hypothetical protein